MTKTRHIADLSPDNPIRISRAQIWASFTLKEIQDMSILAKSKNNDIRSMGEWLMADYASWQAAQIQPEDNRILVVHCKKDAHDVYVGRPTKWGNPFKIGEHGAREDVIAKYREWILAKPDLVRSIRTELKNKVLACWCAPRACHADVLAELANPGWHPNRTRDADEPIAPVNYSEQSGLF